MYSITRLHRYFCHVVVPPSLRQCFNPIDCQDVWYPILEIVPHCLCMTDIRPTGYYRILPDPTRKSKTPCFHSYFQYSHTHSLIHSFRISFCSHDGALLTSVGPPEDPWFHSLFCLCSHVARKRGKCSSIN